jgi:hypothetical protein
MNEEFDTDDDVNKKPALDHEVIKYMEVLIKNSIFSREQLSKMAGCKVGAINAWCRGENLGSHRYFLNIMEIISAAPNKIRHFDYPKNIINVEKNTEEFEKKIISYELVQKKENAKRKVEKPQKSRLPQTDESKKLSIGELLKIRKTNSTDNEHSILDDSDQSTRD